MPSEPYKTMPEALRPPVASRNAAITTEDLCRAPVIAVSADGEGWPEQFADADALANLLIDQRVTLAVGDTESIWKLLPPVVGAEIAATRKMVKHDGVWWGQLSQGSIICRRGRDYGHLCNIERLMNERTAETGHPRVSAEAAESFSRRLFGSLAANAIYDCGFPNSAGSIAQNILLRHATLPNVRRGDIPWPVLELARQCDKGGRMEALQLGTFSHAYCYDFTGAYAACFASLPDASRCTWVQSRSYHADSDYGFIRCRVSIGDTEVSPIAYRAKISDAQEDLEGLRFVTGEMECSLIKPEYDLLLETGHRAEILDAWWGYCDYPDYRPFESIVHKLFGMRADPELKTAMKLLVNAMVGQLSSQHEGSVSPCWNSVYASYVRGLQRVKLYHETVKRWAWSDVAGLTIDGMITTTPTDVVGDDILIGTLRLDAEGPCTILTDFAKDRPGEKGAWRSAAERFPASTRSFFMPFQYRAGIRVYNRPGMGLYEAHRAIGTVQTITPEFPVGSCTRQAPQVTLEQLLTGNLSTESMYVGDL